MTTQKVKMEKKLESEFFNKNSIFWPTVYVY